MTKTMAEVLAEHQLFDSWWSPVDGAELKCTCTVIASYDDITETDHEAHARHQAAALSAAGYGLVADAKRGALESAADDLDLPGSSASGYYASEQDSGYREAERHVEAWLRARAAEMRQG